jgi:NADH-quinone oxidoreductase subunit N
VAQAPVAVVFATLGAVALSSATDLGLIVLFLQMMSMAGYVLASLDRARDEALEATIKYFIYGATALAIMGYGLTFVYGLTGSLDLRIVGEALGSADVVWVALALALVLVGYGFEMTMVPFHFWAPDVFTGATAPVAGFLSVVPKLAGTAALLRFLLHTMPDETVGWPVWVATAAIVTMTAGNLLALRQERLKRLLAYSSIAQAGYVLAGVAVSARSTDALPAIGYYLIAYLFMNLAAFAVVGQLERSLGVDTLVAARGLARRAPAATVVLALALLSLAGIPPLAGFAGKVLVLEAVIDGGMTWLAIAAAINMTVALYYYVRVIAETILHAPVHDFPLPHDTGYVVGAAVCTGGTLLFGLWPGPPLAVVEAIRRMLG